MPEENQQTLKALLEVVNTKGHISHFVEAFKFAVETLNKMKAATGAELSQLRITFDQAVKDLNDKQLKDFTDIKGQLFGQITQALKEQEDGLNYMRDWVRNIPQAKTPVKGVDYFDGQNADEQAIITAVLAQIPPDIEETATQLRDKLETLTEDERLDASAIKGLPEATKQIAQQTPGWGAHPLSILDGGVIKYDVTRTINFGANLTVSVNADGVVTVDASGGSLTELAATGTINSINTTFTFVSKPTYLFIDGVKYRENEGWTWSGLTATTTKAPDYSIWGES